MSKDKDQEILEQLQNAERSITAAKKILHDEQVDLKQIIMIARGYTRYTTMSERRLRETMIRTFASKRYTNGKVTADIKTESISLRTVIEILDHSSQWGMKKR